MTDKALRTDALQVQLDETRGRRTHPVPSPGLATCPGHETADAGLWRAELELLEWMDGQRRRDMVVSFVAGLLAGVAGLAVPLLVWWW